MCRGATQICNPTESFYIVVAMHTNIFCESHDVPNNNNNNNNNKKKKK